MADHALRCGNAAGELMLDGMSRFVFWNADVAASRPAEVARSTVEGRMSRITIVRINDVTRCASRRSIIAGMIIGAQKIQRRIEQPRLL